MGLEGIDTLDEIRTSCPDDISHTHDPHMEWISMALSELTHREVGTKTNPDHGDDAHEDRSPWSGELVYVAWLKLCICHDCVLVIHLAVA